MLILAGFVMGIRAQFQDSYLTIISAAISALPNVLCFEPRKICFGRLAVLVLYPNCSAPICPTMRMRPFFTFGSWRIIIVFQKNKLTLKVQPISWYEQGWIASGHSVM